MKQEAGNVQRQLRSLCAMALLSPILRLIPGWAAQTGRAAWLGPLAALPATLLFAWAIVRLRKTMEPGETLPELLLRRLGRRAGRLILLLLGAWLLLYCGFTLRACAQRFLVTVYPHSPPWFFLLTMGLLALAAALHPLEHLMRTARIVEPLLLGVLGLILLTALRSADPAELLPLTAADAGPLLLSALPALDIGCFGLTAFCFFCPAGSGKSIPARSGALWLGGAALLLTALGAAVQGHFGAALSERLAAPFFTLVRNLRFFHSLERIEALVVGFWIFPDFLLAGLSLHGCQRCLRLALGWTPKETEPILDLSRGRWLIWAGAAAALILGLLLGGDSAAMLFWSRRLIPSVSLGCAVLLVPGLLLDERLRRDPKVP